MNTPLGTDGLATAEEWAKRFPQFSKASKSAGSCLVQRNKKAVDALRKAKNKAQKASRKNNR